METYRVAGNLKYISKLLIFCQCTILIFSKGEIFMKTRKFVPVLTFVFGIVIGAFLIGFAYQDIFKDVMAEQETEIKVSMTEPNETVKADLTKPTNEYGDPCLNPVTDLGETYEESTIRFLSKDKTDLELLAMSVPTLPGQTTFDKTPHLHSDNTYYIQYNFSDRLKTEIKNGDRDFSIIANYSFEVDRGDDFRVDITVLNNDSKNAYTCTSYIEADDYLCVKHFPNSYETLDLYDDHIIFNIYTSALPDDGPKTTEEAFSPTFSREYSVSGVDDWSNIKSQTERP